MLVLISLLVIISVVVLIVKLPIVQAKLNLSDAIKLKIKLRYKLEVTNNVLEVHWGM